VERWTFTDTQVYVGVQDAEPLGLGGWTLSANHVYDSAAHVFWGGNGKRRGIEGPTSVINTVAGVQSARGVQTCAQNSSGSGQPTGDDGPALGATFNSSTEGIGVANPMAAGPDGSLYVGDFEAIRRIDPQGIIHHFAGNSTDSGPASTCGTCAASLAAATSWVDPISLAVGPDSSVYVASTQKTQLGLPPVYIQKIDPEGRLTTVAGYAGEGFSGPLCADGPLCTGGIFDPSSGVTSQLTYNAADQVAAASRSDGTTLTYTYDGFLETSASLSGAVSGSVSWTYDNFFRVVQRTVNGGIPVVYSYDNDNLYTGTSSPLFSVTRDYANAGRIASTTLGSVTDTSNYNGFSELMSYTATSASTTLYQLTMTSRDLNGRIAAMTEGINGATHDWSFAYDSRGRLTSSTRDSTTNTYSYDPNGNRLTMSGGEPWTYDSQDRLISAPGISYTYRNDGTATSKTTAAGTFGYVYDLGGFLQSVSLPSGNSVQYTADARNRRIARSLSTSSSTITQQFVYDSQLRVAAELGNNGSTVTSVFVYGTKPNVPDYMLHGSTIYRIISDWLGSVRLVVNASNGAVVQELDYDEFGNVLPSSFDTTCAPSAQCFPVQPFGFAGGLQDRDTGLVRFGARDYDPQAGRWLSKDSSRFEGGLNLYGYAGGDPINFIDPNGKIIVPIVIVAIAVALAVFGESDMGGDMSANLGPVLALGGSGLAASLALDASIDAVLAQLAQVAPSETGICGAAAAANTVIGRFPDYVELAESLNATYFSVAPEVWEALTPTEQWAANQAFLDQVIARGDIVTLASPLSAAISGTFFAQEVGYLMSMGYVLNNTGTALLPGGH
jgi:RHS repeat-associated protein